MSCESRGRDAGNVTAPCGRSRLRASSSGVTDTWSTFATYSAGKVDRMSRGLGYGPGSALGARESVTFPASSSRIRRGPVTETGSFGRRAENPPICPVFGPSNLRGPGVRTGRRREGDGRRTSWHPCAVISSNPSRPGRLVAATPSRGRHETPGTHLGRPGLAVKHAALEPPLRPRSHSPAVPYVPITTKRNSWPVRPGAAGCLTGLLGPDEGDRRLVAPRPAEAATIAAQRRSR
jgi:hypothetical protein